MILVILVILVIVVIDQLTPKAFANFSPGFEEREPWGCKQKIIY